MQNKLVWLFIITLSLGFTSCDSNRIFDKYTSVSNSWDKAEIISFKIIPTDSINPHNLFVNIRNTNEYKYNNLFLIVQMDFPNGKVTKDTLEYQMAKPNGELLGSGFTDIKESKLWYKGHETQFVFQESGTYKISIQHAMRDNGSVKGITSLEGITDVGFRVENVINKK